MAERFEIGDEVDIRFDRSIITGVRRWKGGCAITVQTADTEFSFDVDAVDTTVAKSSTAPKPSGMACETCEKDIEDGDTYAFVPGSGGLVQCGEHARDLGELRVRVTGSKESEQ